MARSPQARWYAAIAVLLVFLLLAWLLGEVLTLTGGERTVLRVGLLFLGLIAAAALLWYLRPGADAQPVRSADDKRDDLVTVVDAARARLPRGSFDAMPLVLVAGIEGSCKTTIVTRSGLDAQLLAGDAGGSSGETPAKTESANLWIARENVLAEAGGSVLADGDRWRRLSRELRGSGFAAALGRGEPAPRAVVVCVPCDLFYQGGAGQQLDDAATLLRARLGELATTWGLAVPVYVLFTKADRIPHWEDWVAPFSRDEVKAPLGAALPFDVASGAAAGGYAERLVPRLESAFRHIAASLAGWRLELLGRESVLDRRLGSYEVPREVAKLAPAAIRFLTEICRPQQLGVSPMLRGFYFVGARPVVVTDVAGAPAAARQTPAAAPVESASATALFKYGAVQAPAPQQPAAYTPGAARRVPQWTFLERFFPDVVMADHGAEAAARGGVRVSRLRRALLGGGIAAAVLLVAGVGISWARNSSLTQRTTERARAVAALPIVTASPGTFAFPSAEALRTLDGLRAMMDTLSELERHPKLGMRMGLWQVPALRNEARRVWMAGYKAQLHDVAWTALVDTLRALPDQPVADDDYGARYGQLRAYLITTAEPARSTPELVAPVLLTSWRRGQQVDADIQGLARRQFELYASELPRGNPFPQQADGFLVAHSRAYVSRFTGEEQIYRFMLAEASKATPPARLIALAPGANGVVSSTGDVEGAFTAPGWAFMQQALRDGGRFFDGEQWVMGDQATIAPQDRDRILTSLRARYRDDYANRWRGWVRGLAVVRPSSVRDASAKLGAIGGAQSPLLAALAMAARNTAVDSSMAAAFQPVQVVTPGTITDKFVSPSNEQYVKAVIGAQVALEQAANLPPATDTASAVALVQGATTALNQVTTGKGAAREIAGKFAVGAEAAQVGPAVQALLLAPFDNAESALRPLTGVRFTQRAPRAGGGGGGAPVGPPPNAAQLNARGANVCALSAPILAKFPFNAEATTAATMAEVKQMLAPNTGAIWSFYNERLQGILQKQGNRYQAVPGPVTVSSEFEEFFNRAARISNAMFGGGDEPHFTVQVKGVATKDVPTIILSNGSQGAKFSAATPATTFSWPQVPAGGASLKIEYKSGLRGRDQTLASGTGEWALFRVFTRAGKWEDSGGGNYRVTFNSSDRGPVVLELSFPSGQPVLKREWLSGMICASQVTR
jgi:type VI secretion system protein ImpL